MSIGLSSPDHTAAINDPGDETARRYRFQYTWAAIVCCMLLDETQDVVEVFCEHHEDVLIKHSDGKFTGHQVKTRDSGQPAWKANDDSVKSACARFVQLESRFPGHFRCFRFLTAHPLFVARTAQSLEYVLSQIAGAPNLGDLPSGVVTWLRRISRQARCPDAVTFQGLKKTTASADLPKLSDSIMRLVNTLTGCWTGAGEHSHGMVMQAAQALVDECARASALDHEQTLPGYILATEDHGETVRSSIQGKRMTADRVQSILALGLSGTALLLGEPERRSRPGDGSRELLLKKLDAGGFSAVSLNSAKDLRDKADYLGIVWTNKLGQMKGLERYEHIRTLTLSDAARAFEATRTDEKKFGPAMREELRRRFQERRSNGDQLYDCDVIPFSGHS